jgi:lipid-A-disaccharide synthase-like uncharacterized protein
MGVIGWIVSQDSVWSISGYLFYKIAILGGSIVLSLFIYLGIMYLLKSEELSFLLGIVREKFRR